MERETEGARDAYQAYQRAFNSIVYGSEEPSAAEVGRQFDLRYGLWLPPARVKRAAIRS